MNVGIALLLFAGLLLSAALLTWLERRLLGLWQDRHGPNRAGPFGLLQPVADMIKILTKEDWIPPFADKAVFVIAPAIILGATLMAFAVVPLTPDLWVVDLNIGLLFFLAMTSVTVYAVALGGWSSNNKYSLLGGVRSAAQMISYEVFMGLSLAGVWFVVPQFFGFVAFVVAGLAESHRLPLDLPEAEHELTAGFHTEYSGMKFGMFFVGEYVGVVVTSAMIVTLFFGGWQGPWLPPLLWFCIKTGAFVALFVLLRAAIPRPRYDQLMAFGWKVLLPLTLVNFLVTGAVLLARQGN